MTAMVEDRVVIFRAAGLCSLNICAALIVRTRLVVAAYRVPAIIYGGRMAEDLAFLVYRTALGDQRAFERLYRQSSPRLYGLALSILRRKDQAEDVLQESFVNIWHAASTFSPDKGSAEAWMSVIVRHRCIDRIRREPRAAVTLEDFDWERIEQDGPSPDESLQADVESRLLARCLETLDDRQRQSVTMAYFGGMTHTELAAQLKAPLGTVKAWVRRGLERLRGCLHHEV